MHANPRNTPAIVLRLMLTFGCLSASAVFFRIAADAALLRALGSTILPSMYLSGALISAAASVCILGAITRSDTTRTAVMTATALAIGFASAAAAARILPMFAPVAAYLLTDTMVFVAIPLFWSIASRDLSPVDARRHFGSIGAAGTTACLLAGALAAPINSRFGVWMLFVPAIVLLLLAALLIRSLGRGNAPLTRTQFEPRSRRLTRGLMQQPTFVWLVALMTCAVLLQIAIDFNFKSTYAALPDPDAMVTAFGRLYAITSAVTLVLQLLVLRPLLERSGILAVLSLHPVSILFAAGSSVMGSAVQLQFTMKALEASSSLALLRPAYQLLLRGIPRESRAHAQTVMDSLLRPLVAGGAGALLAISVGMGVDTVPVPMIIALCTVMLLCAVGVYRSYLQGLLASIDAGKLEEEDQHLALKTKGLRKFVDERLTQGSDPSARALLGALSPADFTISSATLGSLLRRTDPELRRATIEWIAGETSETAIGLVLPFLGSENPRLRIAATRAVGACRTLTRRDQLLLERREDAWPEVRALAAAGLLASEDPGHRERGRKTIDALVEEGSVEACTAIAMAVRGMPAREISSICLALLRQRDAGVRRAALRACLAAPSPDYVPALLRLIEESPASPLLVQCIDAIGSEGTASLAFALDRAIREQRFDHALRFIRVASFMSRSGILTALHDAAMGPYPRITTEAARAFADVLDRCGSGGNWSSAAESLFSDNCTRAAAIAGVIKRLDKDGDRFTTWLLRSELARRLGTATKLAACLGEQLHARVPAYVGARGARQWLGAARAGKLSGRIEMGSVGESLASEERERREQTLEVLFNLLPMPLYEKLRGAAEPPECAEGDVTAEIFARCTDGWSIAGGLQRLGRTPTRISVDEVTPFLADGSSAVREMARALVHASAPVPGAPSSPQAGPPG